MGRGSDCACSYIPSELMTLVPLPPDYKPLNLSQSISPNLGHPETPMTMEEWKEREEGGGGREGKTAEKPTYRPKRNRTENEQQDQAQADSCKTQHIWWSL